MEVPVVSFMECVPPPPPGDVVVIKLLLFILMQPFSQTKQNFICSGFD